MPIFRLRCLQQKVIEGKASRSIDLTVEANDKQSADDRLQQAIDSEPWSCEWSLPLGSKAALPAALPPDAFIKD